MVRFSWLISVLIKRFRIAVGALKALRYRRINSTFSRRVIEGQGLQESDGHRCIISRCARSLFTGVTLLTVDDLVSIVVSVIIIGYK